MADDIRVEDMDPEMIREFKVAFKLFDYHDVGAIRADELGTVMRSLGQDPSPEELQQMIDEADTSGDNEIDFDEFCVLMWNKLRQTDVQEEQRKAFRIFDKDGDGYISPLELYNVMVDLGNVVTDEEIAEMIKEADRDGNGLIDFYEFSMMLAGGALHL